MATINKIYQSMGLPMNIKRGNPWPLDASSVWYSYDEMKTYAENSAISYVGQILALVDEEKKSAEIYIISDEQGSLKQAGGSVLVDNETISSDNQQLGLKDFGKRYYKYIPEIKGEDGSIIAEATYQLTNVDDNNPWIAGLEPRVVLEDGVLVLGWFEQNPTTIDGVNAQVATLQTTVADLAKELGDPAQEGKPASGIYLELNKKANINETYTKEEVNSLIAAVDHLQRKIVSSYTDILNYINQYEDAHKYIFMVPDSLGTLVGENKYEEYVVIDGVPEAIGKWTTDLSDYVSKDELNNSLDLFVKKNDLNESLNKYVSFDSLNEELKNYTDTDALDILLSNKVDKQEGYRLISFEELEKLDRLSNENNSFIKSVSDDFIVNDEGKLSLSSSEGSIVAELNQTLINHQDSLDDLITKVAKNEQSLQTLTNEVENVVLKYSTIEEAISGLNSIVSETKQKVENNKTLIDSLNESLKNYVTIESYNADITDIYKHLTWSSIEG